MVSGVGKRRLKTHTLVQVRSKFRKNSGDRCIGFPFLVGAGSLVGEIAAEVGLRTEVDCTSMDANVNGMRHGSLVIEILGCLGHG